jgi:hypothetical protein
MKTADMIRPDFNASHRMTSTMAMVPMPLVKAPCWTVANS